MVKRLYLVVCCVALLASCSFSSSRKQSQALLYTAPYGPIPGVPEIARKPRYIASSKSAHSNKTSGEARYHTVRTGETLWKIGQKYGTSWQKIQKANNLKNSNIWVGQRLRIPS